MSSKLSDERRSELTALSFLLFLIGTFGYTKKDGVSISIGWPSLVLAAIPWTKWFSAFLFENFRKVKVGSVELEIATAVRTLKLNGFALGVSQSDFPIERQIALLPKISVAEYQLAFVLANPAEVVTRAQRKQVSILATKIGHFYIWRCLAEEASPGTTPAFAGIPVELEKSAHYYRLAIRLRRSAWRPWNGLGSVWAARRNWSEARTHFEKATGYNPKRAAPWYNLALTCDQERGIRPMTAGEIRESRMAEAEHYRRALSCDGGLWNAQYNLAFVLAELGLDEAAIDALRAAREIDERETANELAKAADQALFRQLLSRLGGSAHEAQLREIMRL